MLLDCGDGSIRNLMRFGVDVQRISNIFISHYHSDHITGLTQIVETMGIRKREKELNVYGLPGLKDYFTTVERITSVAFNRKFKINLNEISFNQELHVGEFKIKTHEMVHTLPCIGYRLEAGGKLIAYTGDTEPCAGAIEVGRGADLFIHEATFLKKDVAKARQSKHSLPSEAAENAKSAGARKLVLTHVHDFAENEDEMIEESKPIFKDTHVAYDGLVYTV